MARLAFHLVLGGAAVLLLAGSASVPLLDPDEARFARTSVEMLEARDPVLPLFEGRPRLVKPPLLHWIQIALFALFGVSEWAARLPAALATLGSMWLVGRLAAIRFGGEAAAWAAGCLLTMPLVFVLGRIGTLDALLAIHVLAVVAVDLVPRENGGGPQVPAALGGLLGLAFLVKGPVGVLLPLLMILAGRTAAGREMLPSARRAAIGVAGFSVVALPWGLALMGRVGAGRVLETLRVETLDRYFAGTAHEQPFWFYLPVVAVAFLPWLVPLASAFVRMLAAPGDPAGRTARYVAACLVAGVVFFSAGRAKLPSYLLPLAAPAALLITWEIGRQIASWRRARVPAALTVATLVLLAGGLAAYGRAAPAAGLSRIAWTGAAIYAAGAIAGAVGWLRRRPRELYGAAGGAAAGFLLVAGLLLLPHVARTRTSAFLIDEVPALRSARPVIVVDMKVPSLTFYLERPPESVDMADFRARLERGDDPLFVFDEADLPAAPAGTLERLAEVGRQGKYLVFEKRPPA